MYQIKRQNKIVEQVQLVHQNGDIACTLDVDIDVDKIGAKINKAYELVGIAQNELQKNAHSQEAMDAYGAAVLALFTAIFGEDGCAKIVEFYGDKGAWTEMLIDMFPFINGEIIPAVQKASAARKKQIEEMAKVAGRRSF